MPCVRYSRKIYLQVARPATVLTANHINYKYISIKGIIPTNTLIHVRKYSPNNLTQPPISRLNYSRGKDKKVENNNAEEKLTRIKGMYEKGLLTEAQYNEQVKLILNAN
jgi:hypothetical protein